MELLDQMVDITTKIKDETVAKYSDPNIEWYVTSFNSLLLDRSSALVNTAPIWSDALAECSVVAESSYFLATHGFYEEASALLRTLLEGFRTRMYWHIRHRRGEITESKDAKGKTSNAYADWALGLTEGYISSEVAWKTILQEPQFDAYDQQYTLKVAVWELLNKLNLFVHGRPTSRHPDEGSVRSSSLNLWFNSKHFDEWFENLRAVTTLVFVISFLEYPALTATKTATEFANLEPDHTAHVRNVL